MKKTFLIIAIIGAFCVSSIAQSTSPRFGTSKNADNTARTLTYKVITSNDAAGNDTIAFTPNAWETIVRPSANLVDSVNIKAVLTSSMLGDYLTVIINKGSGAGAVRFPSAYFITDVSTQRYTIAASKTNVFRFQFNGSKYIMIGKTVQP